MGSAIPPGGMDPKEPKTLIKKKNTCTPKIIAELYTNAKIWKQPNCPSTDEKRTWYTFSGLLLCHKKNEIFPSARTWMDLEGIMK